MIVGNIFTPCGDKKYVHRNKICSSLHMLMMSQRAHDAITTSSSRQNDVATSFWRNNDFIIASYARWGGEEILGRY